MLLLKPVNTAVPLLDPEEQLPRSLLGIFQPSPGCRELSGFVRAPRCEDCDPQIAGKEDFWQKNMAGWMAPARRNKRGRGSSRARVGGTPEDTKNAATCTVKELSEAAWNLDVHGPLLELAAASCPGVERVLVTTAGIAPKWLPPLRTSVYTPAYLQHLASHLPPPVRLQPPEPGQTSRTKMPWRLEKRPTSRSSWSSMAHLCGQRFLSTSTASLLPNGPSTTACAAA